ncbi:YodC family protein [Phytobacter diazotrophicus]|uniref:YodC family protein n=1 Tax=Phytobacter diazotrophicus TaxID=395631 RepID=UPI003B587CF6
MANNLAVGTVVQLKSGGPLMTVSYISIKSPGEYTCIWFLNGDIKSNQFKGDTLKIVNDPL